MPAALKRRYSTHVLVAIMLLAARPLPAADAIGTWGMRASTPQLFSVSGGVLIGEIDPPPDFKNGTH